MSKQPTLAANPETEEDQDTVRAAFARLYSDGRAYADAEIERQKLRAGIVGSGVKDAVIFGAAGFLIAISGLIAFLVGLIITLQPHVGAGWATIIIFGSSLLVALLLLLLAKTRIARMKKAVQS
ncbi:hypothetical protein [Sphingobium sp. ZW T5_29]|uniref:hypothetical protein n=1 Tax=Sphingobium sp. ZW T5_29 TaxID=3378077 RepID=UPI0038540FC2